LRSRFLGFLANCQLPIASCYVFKDRPQHHFSALERIPHFIILFAFLSSKKSAKMLPPTSKLPDEIRWSRACPEQLCAAKESNGHLCLRQAPRKILPCAAGPGARFMWRGGGPGSRRPRFSRGRDGRRARFAVGWRSARSKAALSVEERPFRAVKRCDQKIPSLRRRPSRSAAERPKEDQPKGSGQKRTAAVEAHSVEERPFRAV
jgi:hypothetical protein